MDAQTIILLVIAGVVLLLILGAYFIRRPVVTTVAGFSWERRVLLEQYDWVEETSHSGFPAGSRNQQRTTESYQSYEVVRQETRTNTVNGITTTTTEPVYGFVPRTRTKYMYEIQEWSDSRELVAEGEERPTVHWPAYTLDSSTQEQVKRRQEKYVVVFQTAKGEQYKRELPYSEWAALDNTATHLLKVNMFGRVMDDMPNTGVAQNVEMPEQTS